VAATRVVEADHRGLVLVRPHHRVGPIDRNRPAAPAGAIGVLRLRANLLIERQRHGAMNIAIRGRGMIGRDAERHDLSPDGSEAGLRA
jgi:hypothetical protein